MIIFYYLHHPNSFQVFGSPHKLPQAIQIHSYPNKVTMECLHFFVTFTFLFGLEKKEHLDHNSNGRIRLNSIFIIDNILLNHHANSS